LCSGGKIWGKDDGGNTWKAKRLTFNSGKSTLPSITVYGANIYVVWEDDTPSPGFPEIYFIKSNDSGNTWSEIERLTNNEGASSVPKISQ